MKRLAFLLIAWALSCAAPALADPAGAVSPGTSGTQSWLAGCRYTAAGVTLQDGQQTAVQCDANGKLITNATGGGGGGAITAAAGSYSAGALVDGADTTEGTINDAAAAAGGTGTLSAKLREETSLLNSILAGVTASVPGGSNTIGVVNLGTLNGAATAANQSTQIATENQISVNTAASVPAGTNFIGLVGQGPSALTASATTDQHCTVACASNIVTGAHNLYGTAFSATAAGWLLLEDATSCAANGTVAPKRAYAYPTANVTTTISWNGVPLGFATGIAECFSTTGPFTATASTTAYISADYK